MTDSLFIINSENIPKHTAYLILILVFEKYYFTQVFNRSLLHYYSKPGTALDSPIIRF